MRKFLVVVTGTCYDQYEIEAESHEEAKQIAKDRFRDERSYSSSLDDIESEAESTDDE